MTFRTNKRGEKSLTTNNKIHKQFQCYLMLSPQILGFLVFSIFPMLWAIRLSWFFYNGIESQTYFVGWENFVKLFQDEEYWQSLLNTFLFAIMKMPIELPLALLLAVLLNQKIRGAGFYRAMFYLPHVISTAIIALVFSNIFSYFGIINAMMRETGLITTAIDWFGTKMKAMWVIVIADTWKSFGVNVLYFLAAMQNIPEDVYEACKIDGAGRITVFFKITLPLMAPVLQVILMLSIIGTLNTNELVLVLTNGAPGGTTFTVMSYIFRNYAPGMADQGVNVGYGCAMALVTGLILAAITLSYQKYSNKLNDIY